MRAHTCLCARIRGGEVDRRAKPSVTCLLLQGVWFHLLLGSVRLGRAGRVLPGCLFDAGLAFCTSIPKHLSPLAAPTAAGTTTTPILS